MWDIILILVPYPTTLLLSVLPNFASIKSYMAGPCWVLVLGGCAKTYETVVCEDLLDALYFVKLLP